jgi:glycosyltransferase involved in cell wall biosynthesis
MPPVPARLQGTLAPRVPSVPDIALVSLATTPGLRRSDEAFASLVREAGASCEVTTVTIGAAGRLRRHAAVTDLVEALAARRSARGAAGRAIVYSTITAALLQRPDAPYGIRFDAVAALNRPGAGGAWQRAIEPRRLRGAGVLMPVSRGAEEALPPVERPVVRVPIPIDPLPGAPERDLDAVAYGGYPRKRGIDVLCAAGAAAAPPGTRLVVGGADRDKALRWLERRGVPEPPGVEWAGDLPRERWLEAVGRARVFVNASRWEDFGIAPLEALSAGTPVVTVPTPGSFEALPLVRELAPELVAAEVAAPALAEAIRAGLGLGEPDRRRYAERAADLLGPYRRGAVRAAVADRVLPALGVA